jgi:hypothetical protein
MVLGSLEHQRGQLERFAELRGLEQLVGAVEHRFGHARQRALSIGAVGIELDRLLHQRQRVGQLTALFHGERTLQSIGRLLAANVLELDLGLGVVRIEARGLLVG